MTSTAPTASDAAAVAGQLVEAFLKAGPEAKVKLAFSFLDELAVKTFDVAGARRGNRGSVAPNVAPDLSFAVLPDGHNWVQDGVPLELCEFLAYKTALAYQDAAAIHYDLTKCCHGITDFAYFNSTIGDDAMPSIDTQGFGFVFEGKAFVIMRGTTSTSDWRGNLTDQLTDGPHFEEARQRLMTKHGDVGPLIGNLSPGRHLGFAIGWAAVRPQIEAWCASVSGGLQRPLVFSGHSLGGALAYLGAFEMASEPGPRHVAAVVTFGAPKVGSDKFKAAYEALLGDRTVRIESKGDKVPDVTRRSGYESVGKLWEFEQEPLESRAAFLSAIATAKAVLEKEAKEKTETSEKAEREKAAKAQAAKDKADGKPPAPAAPEKAAEPSTQISTRLFMYILLGIGAFFGSLIAIFFVKNALASHNIQQRYANYLSTLSYQRLRALRGGDLDKANRDLDVHLAYIRGILPPGDTTFEPLVKMHAGLAEMPVRLEANDDLALFLERHKSAIV